MKTRTWLALLALLALLCVAAMLLLFRERQGTEAEIWSDGKLLETVSLLEERSITVETARGTNRIVIEDGTVSVTEASCPDQVCVRRGVCAGGAPIVCLPNRLVIRFLYGDAPDGVSG